ncbi:hypothetical protein HanIR_Chr05g0229691 [Helianthus annuus]|nr:hypothetical protein HanIR_Chr05g0229691 [Helianthus annuus]
MSVLILEFVYFVQYLLPNFLVIVMVQRIYYLQQFQFLRIYLQLLCFLFLYTQLNECYWLKHTKLNI